MTSSRGGNRYAIILTSRDGLEPRCLIEVITFHPNSNIERGAPPPHILPHGAVQLGRLSSGQFIMIGRVQLPAVVCIIHQVAAKPQEGGQVSQIVDIAHRLPNRG